MKACRARAFTFSIKILSRVTYCTVFKLTSSLPEETAKRFKKIVPLVSFKVRAPAQPLASHSTDCIDGGNENVSRIKSRERLIRFTSQLIRLHLATLKILQMLHFTGVSISSARYISSTMQIYC